MNSVQSVLERSGGHTPEKEGTIMSTTDTRPVVIIGAGTLGRRIGAVFAGGGAAVRIVDFSAEQRDAALAYIRDTAPRLRDQLQESRPDLGTVAVGSAEGFEDSTEESLSDAWLVIEAVPENLDIKRPLFGTLDRLAPGDAILATNSSSYASRMVIDEVTHRDRVLNMHFAMPPRSMAVELMSDGETSPEIIDRLVKDLPDYGILPFVAQKESTGFIFNRIWAAIKRESLAVVSEGVSTPDDVDAIMSANLGLKAGPFASMDQVGLDVVLNIEDHYAKENPHLPEGPRQLLHRYVDAGKLGKKTGEGFYTYGSDGKRVVER